MGNQSKSFKTSTQRTPSHSNNNKGNEVERLLVTTFVCDEFLDRLNLRVAFVGLDLMEGHEPYDEDDIDTAHD